MDPVEHALDHVVERLHRAFGAHTSRPVVAATVRQCRRELDIISAPALPELVERLARERLRQGRLSGAEHQTESGRT